ncbi:MAG: tRNA pseudouridine(54/55) synthase Pus10 [Candidatus Acetothermia bacterium]|jgi:tRNA pseudouridine synthase 10|nr:tRNA pseudouridine(54/55) synthase Pus10 [Candidatus Acetothermia bacterium]MDH7504695.1 tRNA pseudouridine(54/55) synthase Pus10 [Candidatus Acetothermia bacterium]
MSKILDLAREILAERELCDSCLGRQFGRRSHGLSNRDRGRAIRIMLAMEDDRPYEEPRYCQLCLGHLLKVDQWSSRALAQLEGLEFRSFVVGSHWPEFLEEQEAELQRRHGLEGAELLKHDLNREVGKRLEAALQARGAAVDLHNPEVALLLDLVWDRVELKIAPLFIYGRYKKLVRGIPQTHWPCRACRGRGCEKCDFTGKQYPESVEELISPPVLEAARGSSSAFHGSGREDIDARMLGEGRPFIIEVREPRLRSLDLQALTDQINERAASKVEVGDLRFVTRGAIERLKSGRAEKFYRARVEFDRPVSAEELEAALRDLVGPIAQRTPRRVAHRRADLVRSRRVWEARGELLSEREALIEVRCDGGLYVKELLSGDSGRTTPSLAALLGLSLEVRELDVLKVFAEP